MSMSFIKKEISSCSTQGGLNCGVVSQFQENILKFRGEKIPRAGPQKTQKYAG